MKKVYLAILGLLLAVPALADSPHYLRAEASLDSEACYSVRLKEAGLGNSGFSEIQYDLTCNGSFTVACFNRGGNQVQGQPKNGTGTATESTILQIRNGQTNGTVMLCPAAFELPDPGCTGNQREILLAASYAQCSLDDNLGTASPALPNLSGTGLFIPLD
jgi:hypothetical protein